MKLEKATMAPRIAGNKPKCHENEEIVPGTRSRERHEGAHGNGQSILSVREPIEDDEERVAMRFSTVNLIARYSVICYAQEETSRERTSLEDRRLQHERRRADRKKEEQRAQKEDRFQNGRQIAFMISEHFRVTGTRVDLKFDERYSTRRRCSSIRYKMGRSTVLDEGNPS